MNKDRNNKIQSRDAPSHINLPFHIVLLTASFRGTTFLEDLCSAFFFGARGRQQSLERQSLILLRNLLNRPIFLGGDGLFKSKSCSSGRGISTSKTVLQTHGDAIGFEWRALVEVLFCFFGCSVGMGGMEIHLASLSPDRIRSREFCSLEGCLWRRPKLGSLALLLWGRPKTRCCAGDGGGGGHRSRGLSEVMGPRSYPSLT